MAEATEREAKAKRQKAELTQERKQKAEKVTQETGKAHPPSTSGQHTTGPVANDTQTRSDSITYKCSFLNALHANSFLFSNCTMYCPSLYFSTFHANGSIGSVGNPEVVK